MSKIRKLLKKMVQEVLNEMSATGNVAGYQTPGAFRRKGKNSATSYIEKMGFTLVGDVESNNDGGILSEAASYDSSRDMNAFRKSLSSAEMGISKKFSDALKAKLLGKDVELTGSKGYGQFKTKYNLRVFDVSVEDWYGKEDYQLIITGDDKKQYFVDVSVPITIKDSQPAAKPSAPSAAKTPPTSSQPNPSQPVAPAAQPSTELEKAITK